MSATAESPTPPAPVGAAARASSIALGFAVIVLAMLPAVLDQTILATALPTIAADLGSVTDVSWVVTAYVIAAAATTPLWGKLGDRHGRRRLLEASLTLFLAASALCGLTQDITELIVARSVQGAAAGGLMALAMAAVGDLVSPRERGRYQGYIAAAFAVATVVGPLLGGAIVEGAGWRWVFYLNLPIGLLALAGLRSLLPAVPGHRADARLDLAGAALLAGATTALMLACIWGGERYDWGSWQTIALVAVALVGRRGVRPPRARGRRPAGAARAAAEAGRGDRQRRAVPGDRGALRDHGLRPAVPADDHRRHADRGGPAAGAGHARHHALDRASPGAASPAPGATSASRSPGWR